MKIFVIEDHPKIRENIIKFLTLKWHIVEWAVHGKEALDHLQKNFFDVIILDINLPIMDGKEFLSTLRKNWDTTPVIALTSNSMLDDKLEIFSLWVDDYLTKPFELLELEARILALYKRKDKLIEEVFVVGEVSIDVVRHKVTFKWKEIELGNKEFLIVEFLAKNQWVPKSKSEIFQYAWWEREENLNFDSITLEVHISYIRKKLGKNFIKTIKGVGYVIQ